MQKRPSPERPHLRLGLGGRRQGGSNQCVQVSDAGQLFEADTERHATFRKQAATNRTAACFLALESSDGDARAPVEVPVIEELSQDWASDIRYGLIHGCP